jgi:hypothetical protein
MAKWIGGVAAMTMAALMFAATVQAQGKSIDFTKEPACDSLTPTSMGGPAPKSPRLLVVRYLGSSNHEIAYRNTVLLLNAHYARTAPARPLGFTRDDVKKVDALLIGHGHGDHMSDAPYVAMRTGAPLVGAPITTTQARKMGLGDAQLMTVTGRGGEVKKFKDITVEPMLETIAIILIVLWLLGLVSGYTMGNFIYVLLVIAIVLFLIGLLSGRRTIV